MLFFATAMVVKYADTITKGFATSMSIIVTSLFSNWFFDLQITLPFVCGASVVVISIFVYNGDPSPAPPTLKTTPLKTLSELELGGAVANTDGGGGIDVEVTTLLGSRDVQQP